MTVSVCGDGDSYRLSGSFVSVSIDFDRIFYVVHCIIWMVEGMAVVFMYV